MTRFNRQLETNLPAYKKHHQLWCLTSVGYLMLITLAVTDLIIEKYHLSSRKLNLFSGKIADKIELGIFFFIVFCLLLKSTSIYLKNKNKRKLTSAERLRIVAYVAFSLISIGAWVVSVSIHLSSSRKVSLANERTIIELGIFFFMIWCLLVQAGSIYLKKKGKLTSVERLQIVGYVAFSLISIGAWVASICIHNHHLSSSRKVSLANETTINEVGIVILFVVVFVLSLVTIHDSRKLYKQNMLRAHKKHGVIYKILILVNVISLAMATYEILKIFGCNYIETSLTKTEAFFISFVIIVIIPPLAMLRMNNHTWQKRLPPKNSNDAISKGFKKLCAHLEYVFFGRQSNKSTELYFKRSQSLLGAVFFGILGMLDSAMLTKSLMGGEYNVPTIICFSMLFGLAGLWLGGGNVFKTSGTKLTKEKSNRDCNYKGSRIFPKTSLSKQEKKIATLDDDNSYMTNTSEYSSASTNFEVNDELKNADHNNRRPLPQPSSLSANMSDVEKNKNLEKLNNSISSVASESTLSIPEYSIQ